MLTCSFPSDPIRDLLLLRALPLLPTFPQQLLTKMAVLLPPVPIAAAAIPLLEDATAVAAELDVDGVGDGLACRPFTVCIARIGAARAGGAAMGGAAMG